jgi:hypothetical protein
MQDGEESANSALNVFSSTDDQELAPQSEAELWLRLAQSMRTRVEVQGILASLGEPTYGSRAVLESRLAAKLAGHNDCKETQQVLRSLLGALPPELREEAEAAILNGGADGIDSRSGERSGSESDWPFSDPAPCGSESDWPFSDPALCGESSGSESEWPL